MYILDDSPRRDYLSYQPPPTLTNGLPLPASVPQLDKLLTSAMLIFVCFELKGYLNKLKGVFIVSYLRIVSAVKILLGLLESRAVSWAGQAA